tara:strand:- start:418 stop:747 length:330 start_codon:yes stop_codon:yes gene_type:complete
MDEPTIKEIIIQKDKKQGTIRVTIEARPFHIEGLPAEKSAWKKYRTADVVELIKSEGHHPGPALQESHVNTFREENLRGTWVFKDLDAKPVKSPAKSRATSPKTTKQTK